MPEPSIDETFVDFDAALPRRAAAPVPRPSAGHRSQLRLMKALVALRGCYAGQGTPERFEELEPLLDRLGSIDL
jgi:hypothetical protein